MNFEFNQSEPLYKQIASQLEEMIFQGIFLENEQIPSTTQLAQQLQINPATVLKGMNILVNQDLLEKRRGMGIYVKKEARSKIMNIRKNNFYDDYVKKWCLNLKK